jgi:hypothetical protein
MAEELKKAVQDNKDKEGYPIKGTAITKTRPQPDPIFLMNIRTMRMRN